MVYRKNKDEYYFDRHPGVFTAVLSYCRTGELHVPNDLCGALVRTELMYWGVDELDIEMCCWIRYHGFYSTVYSVYDCKTVIKVYLQFIVKQ